MAFSGQNKIKTLVYCALMLDGRNSVQNIGEQTISLRNGWVDYLTLLTC